MMRQLDQKSENIMSDEDYEMNKGRGSGLRYADRRGSV
jgi:hypothetical protein